jgi:hypothetical protein
MLSAGQFPAAGGSTGFSSIEEFFFHATLKARMQQGNRMNWVCFKGKDLHRGSKMPASSQVFRLQSHSWRLFRIWTEFEKILHSSYKF